MECDVFKESEWYKSVLHAKREVWTRQVTWETITLMKKNGSPIQTDL